MEILLVAATSNEIKPSLTHFGVHDDFVFDFGGNQIKCLITGVGMVSTAFELGKHLAQHSYDLAINVGIAGSFDRQFALGQVLHITDDTFADLGAEDGEDFLSVDELGFGKSAVYPIVPELNSEVLQGLDQAKAITVNRVHGNEKNIAQTIARLQAQVESMEGAAFFYACNRFHIPSLQIRAVSNWVERRNREKWEVELAVNNLNDFLINFLKDLV